MAWTEPRDDGPATSTSGMSNTPVITWRRPDEPRPPIGHGWIILGSSEEPRYFRVVDGKGHEVPADEVPDEVKEIRDRG